MTCERLYPFVAIVGQEKMKRALIFNIINPTLSGVLIRGEKGTGKSTAVRALAHILPKIQVVKDCPFNLEKEDPQGVCAECPRKECSSVVLSGGEPEKVWREIRVVELPVGATEDRVVGTLDLEHALKKGEKRIEPGLLAAAHRGILYVDEVNLLDDHVVDVLLDSAAMGVNTIEREGVSFSHPAKFTLVGTMNPEEGELRPQLLDRFGLCVHVEGLREEKLRVEIMKRRMAFEEYPEAFASEWSSASDELVRRIEAAKTLYPNVKVKEKILSEIAELCIKAGVDGHRADIVILKAAKTNSAYEGRLEVTERDVEIAAEFALPHRLRTQPFVDIIKTPNTLKAISK